MVITSTSLVITLHVLTIFMVCFTAPLVIAANGETGDPPYVTLHISQVRTGSMDRPAGSGARSTDQQFTIGLASVKRHRYTLDFAIDYQYTRYEYKDINSRDRDLHRLQFPITFSTEILDWQVDGQVSPGISTSSNVFKDVVNRGSGDDLFMTGHLEVSGVRNEESAWLAGIASDRRFGKTRVYPIIGVVFSGERLHLRAAFPHSEFSYRLSSAHEVKGRIYPAGHQWRVESDKIESDFDYRYEALRAELAWRAKMWKRITVDLSVGYEFDRSHRFLDDTSMPVDSDVDSSWFIGIGIALGAAPLPLSQGARLRLHLD